MKHKYSVGDKILFPTFEVLMEAGWYDDGDFGIVHPIFRKTFLSYLQICDHEDKEVTIAYQNKQGEYSIEEEGLYDDWPFDLMPMCELVSVPTTFSDKKDDEIKELLYDVQREKDSQQQVELIKTFVDNYARKVQKSENIIFAALDMPLIG